MFSKDFRAQGAIEYLLILGAAILVVSIVIYALIGITSQSPGNEIRVKDSFDSLKEVSGNYVKLNGYYYPASDPISSASIGILRLESDANNTKKGGYNFLFNGFVNSQNNIKTGLFGNALDLNGFQGVYAYALNSNDSNVDSNKGFSVSLWMKGNPAIDNNAQKCAFGLISSRSGNAWGGSVPGWSISTCIYESDLRANKAVFWATDGSNPDSPKQFVLISDKIVLDNQWHFLTISLKTGIDGNAVIFVDGVAEKFVIPSSKMPGHVKNTTAFISTKQWPVSGYFIGKLDEIVFWDKALTPAEVKMLYENALEK